MEENALLLPQVGMSIPIFQKKVPGYAKPGPFAESRAY